MEWDDRSIDVSYLLKFPLVLPADVFGRWEGHGEKEVGVERHTGRVLVQVDKRLFRELEIDALRGNSSKASRLLGWSYERSFEVRFLACPRAELQFP